MTQTERDLQAPMRARPSGESAHGVIRSRLSDYLDGSLPAAELDDVRGHLDSCAACQAFWRTLLRLINTTGQLPLRQLSPPGRERVQAQLDRVPTPSGAP